MKTYKVQYDNVGPHRGTVEVEAETEQEAINKAMIAVRGRMSLPDAVQVSADKFKIIEVL